MKDNDIIELYWCRDEKAITATADTYGNYCYSIAYNVLYNKEDAEECVNGIYQRHFLHNLFYFGMRRNASLQFR